MGSKAFKQRGVSLSGFLVVVVVIILVLIVGMKIGPAYVQDKTIKSKLVEVAHDPEMKSLQAHEIRAAFSKRAAMSDITNVKAEDIEVTKDDSGLTLSVSYAVKIPLIGNASLVLEFNPSSASK